MTPQEIAPFAHPPLDAALILRYTPYGVNFVVHD